MYFNSKVWQLRTLKETTKQLLLSASAKAFRFAYRYKYKLFTTSPMAKRAMPEMYKKYKLTL
jgi:hypothetical protein